MIPVGPAFFFTISLCMNIFHLRKPTIIFLRETLLNTPNKTMAFQQSLVSELKAIVDDLEKGNRGHRSE